MANETGFLRDSGPLAPGVPRNIATRTQRQRILDAMAESCAEKTFAATTIADIVGRAGVSRATFYEQFRNKRECFDIAVDSYVKRLHEAAKSAQSDADSGPETVRKAIAAVLEQMAAEPAYSELLVVEAIAVDATLIDRYRSLLIEGLRISGDPNAEPSANEAHRAYGQAQVLIATQILDDRTAKLPELHPDLVYIALAPFVGQEEALKQAQMAQ